MKQDCRILSIVPYKVLPPTSGGHLSIVCVHEFLGRICEDHVVTTANNGPEHPYPFELHAILETGSSRYIPLKNYAAIEAIAKKYDITHIYCDHPYMGLTAIKLSKRLGKPWFLRAHNVEAQRFRSLGKKWWWMLAALEKHVMKNANGIFFITGEDMDIAMKDYGLRKEHCHHIPYGTYRENAPEGHDKAKAELAKGMGLPPDKPFLYFLGALDYSPNTQAVVYILDEIMPRLNKANTVYEIIIAGKALPPELAKKISDTPNITYAGFLPSLETFLTGCDVMLNPVFTGGGIKTKAVEALGYNKVVVSSHSGAAGLMREVCGNNLLVTPDNDWDAFTRDITTAIQCKPQIPPAFYQHYYWGNIARNIKQIMCP